MEPVEAKVADWDFVGAVEVAQQIQFEETDLTARLDLRRDELQRLAELKTQIISRINATEPLLKKRDLDLHGMGGVFGRHNLVINPRFGTRIIFTAILTELPLSSDPPVEEELCDQCGICVEACPAGALDVEGQTDQLKCLKSSQPYGIGGLIRYIR